MSKKYELIGSGCLKQIRALIDIPRHNVNAGDFGGDVHGEHNLSHEGDCWIEEGSNAIDNAVVRGNAIIKRFSWVVDDGEVCDNVTITNNSWLTGNSKAMGNAVVDYSDVNENCIIKDNARIRGVNLYGDSVLCGELNIKVEGKDQIELGRVGQITEKDFLIQGPVRRGHPSVARRQPDGLIKVTFGQFEGSLHKYLKFAVEHFSDHPELLQQYRQFHANFVKHFSE